MKNRRGWIKIVEAFIAVLLIAGVLLFVINRGYIGGRDISEQVYQVQLAVLREIELDSGLRMQILIATLDTQGFANAPPDVNTTINNRMPDYLVCRSRICKLDKVCPMPGAFIGKDVYAQAVAIATEGENPEMRQLKLFCWTAG